MKNYIFERISIKINGIDKIYSIPKINKCPFCEEEIAPYVLSKTDTDMSTRTFAIIAQCPCCNKYFTMAYNLPFGTKIPELIEYKYNRKLDLKLSTELEKISKEFIKIYKEALTAELYKLDTIAGLGLKKAIEFLIRDYLINIKKLNKKNMLELPLIKIIKNIGDEKIVKLASSYSWINYNDFYNSSFEKKDIEEMKKLIDILSKYFIYNMLIDENESY